VQPDDVEQIDSPDMLIGLFEDASFFYEEMVPCSHYTDAFTRCQPQSAGCVTLTVNPTQVTINAATTFQNLSDAAMGQTFDGATLDLRCESGEPARCINLACLSYDMVSVLNTQFDFSEIHMGTTDASAVAQAMPDPPGPDDVRASLGTASCFILPQAPGGMREKTYCVGQMGMQLLDVWAKAREWHKGTNGPIAAHSRCTLCHCRFSLWRISQAHALNHRLCVPKGVPLPLHRQIWTSARSLTCGRDSSRSIWC
jgi:hypothetical protein